MTKITEIIDYINNFDDKNISISFLVTHGRCGVTLLHSLLDNHEQILTLHYPYAYYFDWESCFKNYKNLPDLVDAFLDISSFSYLKGAKDHYIMGENKDKKLDDINPEFRTELIGVLSKLGEINSKKFLLAVNFVYAKVRDMDLSKVKSIIVCHHHGTLSSYSYNYFFRIYKDNLKHKEDFILNKALQDFPNLKIIHSIRDSFDNMNSWIKVSEDNKIGKNNLDTFYWWLYLNCFGLYYALVQKAIIGDNYKFVKFEDMHIHTKATMIDLASFIGVDYNDVLLDSTFLGEKWWGFDNQWLFYGTDPSRISDKWKNSLENQAKTIATYLFDPIAEKLYYVKHGEPKEIHDLYEFTNMEQVDYERLVEDGLNPASEAQMQDLIFLRNYPDLRNSLINHFYELGKKFNECKTDMDYRTVWFGQDYNS